jgi:myo-inositol-1(or 4)-monophosphatase
VSQDRPNRYELAITLAREAGAILLTYYEKLETFQHKGTVNLVSIADKESEQFLVQSIASAFPNDSIMAEEGGGHTGNSEWEWVIDPLDGTTNFVHGYPFFMVSIGLLHRGERVGGVCYGPYYDELFSAQMGQGAFFNERSIRVSETAAVADALVATGFPYNRRTIVDELLAPVRRVICAAHGIRRAGAATYDQCLLAAGRLDGFFERALNPWDVAAGSLIIQEAGGVITQYDGSPWDIQSPNILATNGHLHNELGRTVFPS